MTNTLETENDQITGILAGDERILWSGRPMPGRHLFPTGTDVYGFFFAIVWTALVVTFAEPARLLMKASSEGVEIDTFFLPFIIGPILFVGIGIFMLSQPFYRYWLAKHTLFVVTTRRTLIITDGVRQKIRGFSNLSNLHTDLRKDGSGNLFFDQPKGRSMLSGMPENIRKLGFVGLENVAEVEAHVQTLTER
jgi:hypothetical protein